MDDFARYDVPNTISYILHKTNHPKISYVGHSQGTLQMFLGTVLSGRFTIYEVSNELAAYNLYPELANKIDLFVGLGPVFTIGNLKSGLRYLAYSRTAETIRFFGGTTFLFPSQMGSVLGAIFCKKGSIVVPRHIGLGSNLYSF